MRRLRLEKVILSKDTQPGKSRARLHTEVKPGSVFTWLCVRLFPSRDDWALEGKTDTSCNQSRALAVPTTVKSFKWVLPPGDLLHHLLRVPWQDLNGCPGEDSGPALLSPPALPLPSPSAHSTRHSGGHRWTSVPLDPGRWRAVAYPSRCRNPSTSSWNHQSGKDIVASGNLRGVLWMLSSYKRWTRRGRARILDFREKYFILFLPEEIKLKVMEFTGQLP